MASSNIAGTLRRSLLIKVISKPAPSREDVASVIELTASKVVEALQAQSMTFYLVEGNEIAFKQVYYSPTLWAGDPAKEKKFQETATKLHPESTVGQGHRRQSGRDWGAGVFPQFRESGAVHGVDDADHGL